jgi:hypothetical protein
VPLWISSAISFAITSPFTPCTNRYTDANHQRSSVWQLPPVCPPSPSSCRDPSQSMTAGPPPAASRDTSDREGPASLSCCCGPTRQHAASNQQSGSSNYTCCQRDACACSSKSVQVRAKAPPDWYSDPGSLEPGPGGEKQSRAKCLHANILPWPIFTVDGRLPRSMVTPACTQAETSCTFSLCAHHRPPNPQGVCHFTQSGKVRHSYERCLTCRSSCCCCIRPSLCPSSGGVQALLGWLGLVQQCAGRRLPGSTQHN